MVNPRAVFLSSFWGGGTDLDVAGQERPRGLARLVVQFGDGLREGIAQDVSRALEGRT